jgi:ribulose-phosphate 3-epimerase
MYRIAPSILSAGNIRRVANAGADTFVAGSAIFGKPDYKVVIGAMRAELGGSHGEGRVR